MAEGRASTQALMSRIGTMYTDFVQRTWLPSTVSRLSLELLKVDCQDQGLGVPPAPGPGDDGADGDDHDDEDSDGDDDDDDHDDEDSDGDDDDDEESGRRTAALQDSAYATVAALIAPCRAAAMRDFVSLVLKPLEQKLETVLATATVPLCGAQAHLRSVRQNLMGVCHQGADALAETWRERVRAALRDNAPPFRLQRFPGLISRLSEWLEVQAPQLRNPGAAAEPYVSRLIDVGTGAAEVKCSLDPDKPTATIGFNMAAVTSAVLSAIAACYVALGGTDEQLRALVAKAVVEERETCHMQRVALQERRAHVEDSVRRLLHLADIVREAEPQTIDTTTLLLELVGRVLPEVPKALQQVHVLPVCW